MATQPDTRIDDSSADARDETRAAAPSSDENAAKGAPVSRENAELALGSLAALLSSAQTNGVQHPILSSSQPALATFLSAPRASSSDGSKEGTGRGERGGGGKLSVPSLSIRGALAKSSSSDLSLQDAAALHLAVPLCVGRNDVGTVPASVRNNVGESLLSLIDSRIRSSLGLLVRQTVKLGSVGEAAVLSKLLAGKPVDLTTVVTSFNVLPGAGSSGGDGNAAAGGGHTTFEKERDGSASVMLPLTFEAVVDANVLGKTVTSMMRAPGTVRGTFHPADDGLLFDVEVALDTIALLDSMVRGAKDVAKRAVRRAAQVAAAVKAKEEKKQRAQAQAQIMMAEAAAATQQQQQEQEQQQKIQQQQELQQQQDRLHHQQSQLQQQLQLPVDFFRAAASFGSLANLADQLQQRRPAAHPGSPHALELSRRASQSEEEVKAARSLLDSTSGLPEHMLKAMAELSSEREVQEKDRHNRKKKRRRKKKRNKHRPKDGETTPEDVGGEEGEETDDSDNDDDREDDEEGNKAQPMSLSVILAQHERVRQEEEEKNRREAAAALISNGFNRPPPTAEARAGASGGGAGDSAAGQGQQQPQLFAWLQGSDVLLKNNDEAEGKGEGRGQQQQQQQQENHQQRQHHPQQVSIDRNQSLNSLGSGNSLGVPQAFAGGNLPYTLSSLSVGSMQRGGGGASRLLPSKKRKTNVGACGIWRKSVSFSNTENETFESM